MRPTNSQSIRPLQFAVCFSPNWALRVKKETYFSLVGGRRIVICLCTIFSNLKSIQFAPTCTKTNIVSVNLKSNQFAPTCTKTNIVSVNLNNLLHNMLQKEPLLLGL